MRTFTRVANMSPGLRDTGDVIDADHINDLQQAIEDFQTGTNIEVGLGSITGALEGYEPLVNMRASVDRATSRVYDIRDFHAVPNDPTVDNIPFINEAIVAANAAGGGEVFVPPGTWWVKPSPSHWIEADSAVTITGSRSARIKVQDDTGDYDWLIAPATAPSAYVEHFRVEGLTIDHNASGNTTSNITTADNGQATFRFDNFLDLAFVGVSLDPYTGVNAFQLLGAPYNSSVVLIADCDGTFERGAALGYYDTSTIYASSRDVTINRNKWRYLAGDSDYPEGCTEVHGPNQIITNNIVEGFGVGTWLVPETSSATNKPTFAAVCMGNTYIRCALGVGIASSNPLKFIRQVMVANNTMYLDTTIFERRNIGGILMSGDAGWAPAEDVMILNNNIRFATGEMRTVNANGDAIIWDTSAGILVSCPTGQTAKGITVAGNVVRNAPGIGIRLLGASGATLDDVWIHHNKIIDAGLNSNIPNTALRTGLGVSGAADFHRCVVEDNVVIDTGSGALNGLWAYRSPSLTGTDKDLGWRRNTHQAVFGSLGVLLNSDLICHETTAALEFSSISAGASAELTVTVKDARTTDVAFASPANGIESGLAWSSYVSAADTVTIRLVNVTGSPIDPASRDWYVAIHRRQV